MIETDRLLELIDQFAGAEGRMKWAPNKKLHFEVAVIKAIQTLSQVTLNEVIENLSALRDGKPPESRTETRHSAQLEASSAATRISRPTAESRNRAAIGAKSRWRGSNCRDRSRKFRRSVDPSMSSVWQQSTSNRSALRRPLIQRLDRIGDSRSASKAASFCSDFRPNKRSRWNRWHAREPRFPRSAAEGNQRTRLDDEIQSQGRVAGAAAASGNRAEAIRPARAKTETSASAVQG